MEEAPRRELDPDVLEGDWLRSGERDFDLGLEPVGIEIHVDRGAELMRQKASEKLRAEAYPCRLRRKIDACFDPIER